MCGEKEQQQQLQLQLLPRNESADCNNAQTVMRRLTQEKTLQQTGGDGRQDGRKEGRQERRKEGRRRRGGVEEDALTAVSCSSLALLLLSCSHAVSRLSLTPSLTAVPPESLDGSRCRPIRVSLPDYSSRSSHPLSLACQCRSFLRPSVIAYPVRCASG